MELAFCIGMESRHCRGQSTAESDVLCVSSCTVCRCRNTHPYLRILCTYRFTTVRKLLEDRSQWGLFMPLAGCSPAPGVYTCGPNATTNLYHDYEQTPPRSGDCGVGVECGEVGYMVA